MRRDILRLISDESDVTNVIVLTHNIDFVFLQSMVLSAMRNCGNPSLTVFADGNEAMAAYSRQRSIIEGLGRRYRVVPILMHPGFRFHPKAVLLSGREKATLLVGSGNLTFGGWRANAEVWSHFETDTDGPGAFADFREYMNQVLDYVPLAGGVSRAVDETFDLSTRAWVGDLGPGNTGALVGRVGRGNSLLTRISRVTDENQVQRATVCSPYFDDRGSALIELKRVLGAESVDLLHQDGAAGLDAHTAGKLPKEIRLRRTGFTMEGVEGSKRAAFIHAKWYALQQGDVVTVLAGSANCSRAALITAGDQGNAELLAVRRMRQDLFRENFLAELNIGDSPPQLPEKHDEDTLDTDESSRNLLIQAARFERGHLDISYVQAPEMQIKSCLVDTLDVDYSVQGDGVIRVRTDTVPTRVQLVGEIEGERVESLPSWVDNEAELEATASKRSVLNTIERETTSDNWSLSNWHYVMASFLKHVDYMPRRRTHSAPPRPGKREGEIRTFPPEEVFLDSYETQRGNHTLGDLSLDPLISATTLQDLFRRWFGIVHEKVPKENGGSNSQRKSSTKNKGRAPSDREQKQTLKLIDQVVNRMTAVDYCENRGPSEISFDLRIFGLLLLSARGEDWIDKDKYFEITQQVWVPLFLSMDSRERTGWIQFRHQTHEDPELFESRMSSPELVAMLLVWVMSVPTNLDTPKAVRFELAAVAIAQRLPWLWESSDREQVYEEAKRVLSATGLPGKLPDDLDLEQRWIDLTKRGEALARLEHALESHTPADLRDSIRRSHVDCGELVWQGASGLAVTTEEANRANPGNTEVLKLHTDLDTTKFTNSFLIPLMALLEGSVLEHTAEFGPRFRLILSDWTSELSLRPE